MRYLPPGLTLPRTNLQRLLLTRALFCLAVAFLVVCAYVAGDMPLPYSSLAITLSALTLFNTLSWLRLRARQLATTDTECFSQLVVDLLGITALLYFTGGANNPFVAYYLVPLCLAATFLPRRFVVFLLVLALLCYSNLFFFFHPLAELAPSHSMHHNATNLSIHTLGMWFNFLLSAFLITTFVAKMASALRQQDAELAAHREENLRDEQLMAVATLAAGTAHELGTPLTTMKTLISDMQRQYPDPLLQEDLHILKNQIQHCTTTLQRLHDQAGRTRQQIHPEEVEHYCRQLFDHWLLLHPSVTATLELDSDSPRIKAVFDPTIEQSIINLLNNAADACPENIQVQGHWRQDALHLTIDDNGPGISSHMQQQLGQPFYSSKGKGRGLGLFLTHATLTRYGGEVTMTPRTQGGTRTALRLPLNIVS